MAESQLRCMEDGHIGATVPETKPEFYYSEEQRAAIEELLKNGDGAFKTRLKDDKMKDFLSAREVKVLLSTFKQYDSGNNDDSSGGGVSKASTRPDQGAAAGTDADESGVHSTYWPQMSDTEVPPLDIGWTGGGLFKGVTRVAVHTHPPKDNGPHIKEVVRRLIQEASKVIAIVMDILTDIQILQDLMDAAWRRSVPVYILLDHHGVPHFLDMCSRLQIGSQHLRNQNAAGNWIRTVLRFSWCTSRMDRNMITVMTGQVVDIFDRDFREMYAISEKLDLYKEFHISPPAANNTTATLRSKAGPKRPPLPATTSRFQVSLGDSRKANIQVPAHKYHNPKYSLVFGDNPRPTGSLQGLGQQKGSFLAELPEEVNQARPRLASSERMGQLSTLPSEATSDSLKRPNGFTQDKKGQLTWAQRIFKKKASGKHSSNSPADSTCTTPTETKRTDENEDNFDVIVRTPTSKWKMKKSSKLSQRTDSEQTVTAAQDNESAKGRRQKKKECKVS
ncbi:hypothetical protein INR49_004574 [Caranx melampygus]|nr:hypothetical protein INR49_004574 [Caranx melampygus]